MNYTYMLECSDGSFFNIVHLIIFKIIYFTF